jgi:N-acetyl-gamma-glutamyl-phosphate reductase
LLPVAEAGAITERVTISALSGVSGAGRAPALRTSFVELDGGAAFYAVGETHVHVTEMSRTLSRVSGIEVATAFAPQLAPMARGILLTASVELAEPMTPAGAQALYETRYASEPFVQVLTAGTFPETRRVRGSNRCDIGVTTVHGGRTLIAMAAIDNLVKGAAGQAVQNLNLLLGWPEEWGLPLNGHPW